MTREDLDDLISLTEHIMESYHINGFVFQSESPEIERLKEQLMFGNPLPPVPLSWEGIFRILVNLYYSSPTEAWGLKKRLEETIDRRIAVTRKTIQEELTQSQPNLALVVGCIQHAEGLEAAKLSLHKYIYGETE